MAIPKDTVYKITGSYYSKMEEGNAACCDNCGRAICNIASIEDTQGLVYTVGMDCASTLTGIKDDFSFNYEHKARFNEAKQARISIQKMIKKGHYIITAKTFNDSSNFFKEVGAGSWRTETIEGPANWKQYRAVTWQNYVLPMIKDLLTNG